MHSKESRRVAGRTPLKVIGFVMLVGVALFCGFVGAAVVGAVFPRSVAFANAMACQGGTAQHDSYGYSYKPGQYGVNQVFSCVMPDGEVKTVTLRTFLYAGLVFSGGAFVVLGLLAATLLPALGRTLGGMWSRRTGQRFDEFMETAGVNTTGGIDLQEILDRSRQAKGRSASTTTVFVNGKQVDLDPEAKADLFRSVAGVAAAAADPHNGATADPEAGGRTVAEHLEEVEKLYREGHLSRAEYDAVRERILADI